MNQNDLEEMLKKEIKRHEKARLYHIVQRNELIKSLNKLQSEYNE